MINYFDLFQLPHALPVDINALSLNYQQLQRQYHPDNAAMLNEQDKVSAIQKSATINSGYQILKNPVQAAAYLLSLHGFDISTEQNIIHDTDFLMAQFELREQLDEIERQENWSQLDAFYDTILADKNRIYHRLLAEINLQNWQTAITQLYKIRYLIRLIEHIEQLQEDQHFV